ncbi:EAL domain-containing protein [Treponema sp.]|uniref:EAL domain-containing protein n=1 Tax=Treponema sp. TaxID=166 RepID=UPI0025CBA68C|nr:EAL domain-containing protein [Treponema sp.]MCR5217119.1 EAL domain-containing protein [Treponema sp.]
MNISPEMIKEAMNNEEFIVYYQPKVSLHRYNLAGAEALCRWMHNGKLIGPDLFIPQLEKMNEIGEFDFYLLEHICKDIRRWLDDKLNVVKTSVNLSRCHKMDESLLKRLISTIDKYRIPHQYIEFELLESTTEVNYEELKKLLIGLSMEGITTSVDDFGIGYSSMNLIRALPWNVIKIDKSFVPKSDSDYRQHTIFRHLISMARDLGLDCIVEGVETIEQVRLLKENKCYLAQGFFFDKPLPPAEFRRRLTEI